MGREAFLAEVRRTLPGTLEEDGEGAILLPRSAHEVSLSLRVAHRLGGSVRAPGADAEPGDVPLSLVRLNEVIAFDDVSRIVHVQGGVRVATVESSLLGRSLTLGLTGPAPDLDIGGWLSLGAPGARDRADDPVDQLLAGLEVILPDGRELSVRPAPRRAVGPDLVSAFVGSRGKIGVIVGAHLVARSKLFAVELAFLFETEAGADSARAWVRGNGVRPARTRVAKVPEGYALVLRIEGEGLLSEASQRVAAETARRWGGVPYPLDDLPPAEPSEAVPANRIIERLGESFKPPSDLAR